ncbi:bifunctional nicotinamidase/pyrazinamidase [Pleomorphovibrio marinus]|uniref:bifunctional nicotinamidase/pyrazinamidase n=1 Tax=Pleomorphovibrio marinus TaxID=2164132 RepID=UPI000E0BECE9|nr:bifunctional nicotinamidase/pyrazinamidase [Pleomorphovibrio marinus]
MKALLVVDVQYDFLPGGSLAVPDGDKVIPVINRIQDKFDIVVATQDWHPKNHGSFASNHQGKKAGDFVKLSGEDQILWPDHCVQGTPGAQIHHDLKRKSWKKVFQKGTNPVVDSYSGFYDNNRGEDTGLATYLKEHGVEEVFVTGLAADYCVKFTVMDAIKEGFETNLVEDATKGVNLSSGDTERAFTEMEKAGAKIIDSSSIP